MERKKTVYYLGSPFSTADWPFVTPEDQETILELLCNLLRPLGQYRQKYLVPSKGKRAKRSRKARQQKENVAAQEGPGPKAAVLPPVSKPPPPELTAFVDVGLSHITRTLASLASSHEGEPRQRVAGESQSVPPTRPLPYAAIFALRAGHESAFHAHFPQMVAVASASSSTTSAHPICLVGFSTQRAIDRLAEALGLGASARVSAVAIREGAAMAGPLLEIVRARVNPVEARWLGNSSDAAERIDWPEVMYRPLVVETVETKVGVARKGKAGGRVG